MSDSLDGVKTMSSVEIVEVINAMRGPGKAEMKHNDFMKKVREHPGINEGNFSSIYFDQLGREKPCYYLPKREAELMVMSESLEVLASPQPARGSSGLSLAQPFSAPSGGPPRGLKSLLGASVDDGWASSGGYRSLPASNVSIRRGCRSLHSRIPRRPRRHRCWSW